MNQEKIGKFIAMLRKEKNFKQEALASALGVSNKTISRWETGKYMPDLSLFPLLSKELGVSVNELMSGEKIDKKEYQDEFEKNVVNTIAKVDKSTRNWNILGYISIGVMILLFIVIATSCVLNYYKFVPKFDSSKIEIIENTTGFEYIIKDSCGWTNERLITKHVVDGKEIGVIFVKTVCTLENYLNYKKNNRDNYDLTQPNISASNIDLSYSNIPDEYNVYYTEISFNKIRNANGEELDKIINESNLVFTKD